MSRVQSDVEWGPMGNEINQRWLEAHQHLPPKEAPGYIETYMGNMAIHADSIWAEVAGDGVCNGPDELLDQIYCGRDVLEHTLGRRLRGWWGVELPSDLPEDIYRMGCAGDMTIKDGTCVQRVVPAKVQRSLYREAGLHFHIDLAPHYMDPMQLPMVVQDIHRVLGQIQADYVAGLEGAFPITWYRRPRVFRIQGSSRKRWVEYRSLSAVCLNNATVLRNLVEAAFELSSVYGG